MSVISANEQLNEAILTLQKKQAAELILLQDQLRETYESLKPINLLKSTFHEITSDSDIKNDVEENFIGIAAGYLSKKIFVGPKASPLKKLFGILLQFIVTNLVSKKIRKKKKHKKKSDA